ncbi:MAG: homocysteine S-methyltransferase family protein [Nannocystaceae bacterium]|nr:homocysteine S-methyltransferase family protein [bacterium]
MTVLLDSAMGTELARRGFELRAPRWGARAIEDAPHLVRAIHAETIGVGAQVVVTASFGLGERDTQLAAASVALARDAGAERIAGSIGPADPSSPPAQRRAHLLALGEALVRGGCDVLFAETHTTVGGAREALEVLRPLGRPVWVSLACGTGGLTLGGNGLRVAFEADAVFVGCTEHVGLEPALARLAPHNATLGVRPSLARTTDAGFDPSGAHEHDVVQSVLRCAERFDLAYAGGCCGTTPAFVASLAHALSS